MKIGIITDFVDEQLGGIGTYTHDIVEALLSIDKNNDYFLIHGRVIDIDIYREQDQILIEKTDFGPGSTYFWRFIKLPYQLKSLSSLDLVHDPYEIGPLSFRLPFKKLITIHDLAPMLYPETCSFVNSLAHRLLLRRTAQTVDKIVTDSYSSKMDIVKYLGISEENIAVIPGGVHPRFSQLSPEEMKIDDKSYEIPSKFILYVGTLEPRKNIPNLIRAYNRLKEAGLEHKLVIVGKTGWKYKSIFKIIYDLNLSKDVILTGYIPECDLPKIYNAADLFVYPSLYEGFGLPPLEAMACGCPVITSNTSSLPEVVGQAGIMVNPHDVKELANTMYTVLTDEGLRTTMIERGLQQAKKFNWNISAKRLLYEYQSIFEHI